MAALLLLATTAGAKDNIDYVDPFIGTTNYSVCNPGSVLPHALMSVVPFNVMGSDLNTYDKDKRWWSAPYEYTNSYFTGFAHVTLSGVGCPELGSLLTMPTMGEVKPDCRQYGTEYEKESSTPGYYSVMLKKYGVKCEVTSTMRTSCERYTFRKGQGNILLNLGDALSNEGGGMAFTFLAAKGYSVGTSLVDAEKIDYCKDMMEKAAAKGVKLLLPVDTVVADAFPDPIDGPITVETVPSDAIPACKMGLDIGEKTRELFADAVKSAKTVVWNGPMGVFENPTLAKGTIAVAQALADSDAVTIVGGR